MLSFFRKKDQGHVVLPYVVDMHSHLLPGLDDGVRSVEESLYILKKLAKLGYRKVITTPHVMLEHYPNKPEEIIVRASEIQHYLNKHQLNITFEAAAEYYLDEHLNSLLSTNEKLLTFHDGYLLFETSFMNKPVFLEEAIFKMNVNGYKPVMAHPERYIYLQTNPDLISHLRNMNVLFQINLFSLLGHYSAGAKRLAGKLLNSGLVEFVGTDCHNALQIDELQKAVTPRFVNSLRKYHVRNHLLL